MVTDSEEETLMGDTAAIEYRGHLARIQRQMVALLPRYCMSDKLLKQVTILLSHIGYYFLS